MLADPDSVNTCSHGVGSPERETDWLVLDVHEQHVHVLQVRILVYMQPSAIADSRFRTDMELSTIRARSPHPPDEPPTPAGTANDDVDAKSLRKSMEMIESGPTEGGSQTGDVPSTATPASTPASRRKARIQFATLCYSLFMAGWNDGTTGPLLPRIQAVYHVRPISSPDLLGAHEGPHVGTNRSGQLRSGLPDLRLQLHCMSNTLALFIVWICQHAVCSRRRAS